MFPEVHVWTNLNKWLFVIVEASRSTCLHHSQQNSWRSNSFWQKESPVPYESIASLRRSCFHLLFSYSSSCFLWTPLHRASDVLSDMLTMHKQADKDLTKDSWSFNCSDGQTVPISSSDVVVILVNQVVLRTLITAVFTQLALRQCIFGRFWSLPHCTGDLHGEICSGHRRTSSPRPLVTYWTTTKLD